MTARSAIGLSAVDVLSRLLGATPQRTALAPKDQRGLYGLVDHHGALRYIGSTVSASQTFYSRIHLRHRTGSEGMSHYFSDLYNTGRMWRQRNDPATKVDGLVAKTLRSAFIEDHCRAVWVALPDGADIAGLERAVIALAPAEAVAWNRRASAVYAEPEALVDRTIARLGYDASHLAALGRQKQRCAAASAGGVPHIPGTSTGSGVGPATTSTRNGVVPPFPDGPFRFFALDVETANHDRGSICQIGVACVRHDDTIVPWVTYVDPQVDRWAFTWLHKINAATVRGAPLFRDIMPVLDRALRGAVVYQHSGFDRGAVEAACARSGLPAPAWDWQDSVQVARRAWPELRGNGGHGLASLKAHLGLTFKHHDAGEDARAAAQVVLHAEAGRRIVIAPATNDDAFDVIEAFGGCACPPARASSVAAVRPIETPLVRTTVIGRTTLTVGNIKNHHIYLRAFFDAFPDDAVGGSNAAAVARRTISVDWGGDRAAVTDLDGEKKVFRKRAWVRDFFARTGAVAGDAVVVERVGPYAYRVSVERELTMFDAGLAPKS